MQRTRWRGAALAYLAAVAVCAVPLAWVEPSAATDLVLRLGLAAGQLAGGLGLLRAAGTRPLGVSWTWRVFATALLVASLATTLDAFAPVPGLAKEDPGLTAGSALLLLWYPLVGLGFRDLLRGRDDSRGLRRDAVTLIDLSLLLIAVGVATLPVAFKLYRGVLGGFDPGAELVVALGFSAMDLAILVPGLALLITSLARRRGGLVPLVLAALLTRPVADVLFAAALGSGSDTLVAAAQVLWWSSWVAVAPLALYPRPTSQPTTRAPAPAPGHVALWRLVVLAGAALVIPLLVALEPLQPSPVAAIARPLLLVSVVLVFARMALLVRELQRSLSTIAALERERGDARVGALVQHVSEIIMLCDACGVVHWASPSLQRQLGHQQVRWLRASSSWLGLGPKKCWYASSASPATTGSGGTSKSAARTCSGWRTSERSCWSAETSPSRRRSKTSCGIRPSPTRSPGSPTASCSPTDLTPSSTERRPTWTPPWRCCWFASDFVIE